MTKFIVMKHKLLFTTLLLLSAGGAAAQTITQTDAEAKAMAFLKQGNFAPARGVTSASKLELSYKSAKGDETYFYIFNEKQTGAFVIVAGDERATEILGYGDHGCLDYEKAPENFKWWMRQYESQIHAAIQQDLKPAVKRQSMTRAGGSDRTSIPELITTKWNQSTPYNNLLPSLGDGYTNNYALATGCVATAMAQVMKYHGYPTTGTGSHSYTGINNLTFEANFGATTYDWNNMRDNYSSGTYNTDEADAVATLMYHCGVAVNMNYGQINQGGSGASASKIPNALTTYFGYDKSAQRVQREYYTDEEWTDLIYSELQSGRPLLYGGQDAYTESGHEFVCHGYNAIDNTFAINWGWGGSLDGYFTLMGVDGLQPGGSGVGGAGDGASYTRRQDLIINVMPDHGTTKTPLEMYCYTNNDYTVAFNDSESNITFDLSQPEQSNSLSFYAWNLSGDSRTFETSLMFRDVLTGATFYAANKTGAYTLNNTGYTKKSVVIKSTEFVYNGTYEVLPVVREVGETEWQRLRFPTSVTTPTITITGGSAPEKGYVNFTISGTTVEQYSTLTISHDKMYTGAITYTATPAGIVSISNEGVVTALTVGNVTITASGEADTYFFETTKDFEVVVTPYVKKDITFSISDNNVKMGNTLTITNDADLYEGTISYSSSNTAVATVDDNGVVRGVAAGRATITASAPATELYNESSESFDIVVTAEGIALISLHLPNNGYITMDRWDFTATVVNNTSNNWSRTYLKCKVPFGGQVIGVSSSPFSFYAGEQATVDFDIYNEYGSYFPYYFGTEYQVTTSVMDYDGNEISEPITFTFCDKLSYTYTMTAAGWGTLCLPFEAEVPTGLTAYKVTGTEGASLMKEEVDFLEMNTPYLLSGNQGTYTFEGPDTPVDNHWQSGLLVGNTYKEANVQYAPEGSYVLQKLDGVLGFYKVSADNTQKVRAYSAYLTLPDGGNGNYYSITGTTDIEQIEDFSTDDDRSYKLDGTRVTGEQKGLVVKNGKLIFVK